MRARRLMFVACVLFNVRLFGATVFVDLPAAANVFQPISVSIQPGDTVTWRNPANGGIHNVVSDDGISFNSGPPAAGPWTYSVIFNTAGTYPYYCAQHGGQGGVGMSGVVFVGRAPHASNEHILHINAYDLIPEFSTTVLSVGPNFLRSASGNLAMGLHLPTGAQLTGMEIEACDFDANSDLFVDIWKCEPVANPCSVVSAVETILSGCHLFSAAPFNEIIDNLGHSYVVEAQFPSSNNLSFRSIRIFYTEPATFAPGAATFNDVPTTHPFFRFVEALAAAGITGGCSANPPQYCPDAPVTRGQMAVFISQALGLYHPF